MPTQAIIPLLISQCLYFLFAFTLFHQFRYPLPSRSFGSLVSPEFCYRPGLSAVSEDGGGANNAGGAPTRPLPPTPDDDDAHGDRTLVMKRVSSWNKHYSCQRTYRVDFAYPVVWRFILLLHVSQS